MRPSLVGASQVGLIGPASSVGAVHVFPPSPDETKPTWSWQLEPQLEKGK